MGGDSTSSNTNITTNTNTSGSVGIGGSNSGTVISGVNDSNITVTDHGAINSAIDAMQGASDSALDFASDALSDVLENNKNTTDSALGVVSDTNSALKDLAMQAAVNAEKASQMVSDAMGKVENMASGGETQKTNALAKIMMLFVGVVGLTFIVKAYKGKK